jgi:hypothetical protein
MLVRCTEAHASCCCCMETADTDLLPCAPQPPVKPGNGRLRPCASHALVASCQLRRWGQPLAAGVSGGSAQHLVMLHSSHSLVVQLPLYRVDRTSTNEVPQAGPWHTPVQDPHLSEMLGLARKRLGPAASSTSSAAAGCHNPSQAGRRCRRCSAVRSAVGCGGAVGAVRVGARGGWRCGGGRTSAHRRALHAAHINGGHLAIWQQCHLQKCMDRMSATLI